MCGLSAGCAGKQLSMQDNFAECSSLVQRVVDKKCDQTSLVPYRICHLEYKTSRNSECICKDTVDRWQLSEQTVAVLSARRQSTNPILQEMFSLDLIVILLQLELLAVRSGAQG